MNSCVWMTVAKASNSSTERSAQHIIGNFGNELLSQSLDWYKTRGVDCGV